MNETLRPVSSGAKSLPPQKHLHVAPHTALHIRISRTTKSTTHMCRATDPGAMQEVLMGGAVLATAGWSILSGTKTEDPCACPQCAGTGGVKCFACEGSGKMMGVSTDEVLASTNSSRGGGRNKRECRACIGTGMLFCKTCNGTGYKTQL
jgi:hypothetical protein